MSTPTTSQTLLTKILKNRINAEIAGGTLEADKDNLTSTLDIFLAGNKITMDEYTELTELINPTTQDTTTTATTNNSTATTTTTTA
ncbi:hypothetical protein [Clostridium sp.]|uniref:hypothetical protein n=1 Tax=Clostridium sp. TaxID=1506 RepID=UPI002608FE91|nr:hypothetical protein [Clostridium sp.]